MPPEQAEFVDGDDYTWQGKPVKGKAFSLPTSTDHIVEVETALHKLTDRVRALELTVHMLLNPNGDGDE